MLNILMLLIAILLSYATFIYVERFACTFYEFLIVSKKKSC